MPKWIKGILNRSCWAYALVILVFAVSVNFPKAFDERGKYLLGIFYNGYFKNLKDGIVYFDYMHRHKPQDAQYTEGLKYCYQRLGKP